MQVCDISIFKGGCQILFTAYSATSQIIPIIGAVCSFEEVFYYIKIY